MGTAEAVHGGPEYGRQAEAILKSAIESLNARAKEVKYTITASVALNKVGDIVKLDPDYEYSKRLPRDVKLEEYALVITDPFENDVKAAVQLVNTLVEMLPAQMNTLLWRQPPTLLHNENPGRFELEWVGYARLMYFQGNDQIKGGDNAKV